jgi:hypothetical protein
MAYTPIDKSDDYFNTVLYTGNGTSQSITGIEFAPKFTWIKNRTSADAHILFDIIRGATYRLNSNTGNAEFSIAQSLTAFNSDGFSVGSYVEANTGGNSFVSWNWKAGTAVSGATTGAGTAKTYTGSVDTTSGFSIIKYTGNGTAGHTIPHNLGVTPSAIFVKGLSAISDWSSYHSVLGNTGYMRLNNSNAFATASTYWNNTSPTSSVFTLGTTGNVNADGNDFIAYCFAEVKGYSKFGSYTGNGSTDGTFIYTGFKPSWIMFKRSDGVQDWYIYDNKRNTYNPENLQLDAMDAGAESTLLSGDFVSNGFKLRSLSSAFNTSGGQFIYMAFAENPFVTSTGIPTPAR